MNFTKNKLLGWTLLLLILTVLSTACGKSQQNNTSGGEKSFSYATMAYGVAMGNAGLNPHQTYSGWSAVRYGVGETLFRFNEAMEIEPWLASGYERLDDYTVRINLRPDIKFSNGNKVNGPAVQACLEQLLALHDRAPHDLQITSITAAAQSITITSRQKVTSLLNYLSDPYGAIIDVSAVATPDKNIIGTGPYQALTVTDTEINLIPNPHYWNGQAKMDRIKVKSITDGDTLTMAMQSGEVDAVQGLPYASLQLFANNAKYKISSTSTSRLYQAALNYKSPVMQDAAVRKAMAMAVDKQGFTTVLLQGNGSVAVGPFPDSFKFGGQALTSESYDLAAAKQVLESAGWVDTDADGIREKNGRKLSISWLTYTSRQELPLLAEAVQASYKEIGIEVKVNATDSYRDFLKSGAYDVFANAFVAAPTGDPQYYFTTHVLQGSEYNRGYYYNEQLEKLVEQLRNEFDPTERNDLAVRVAQQILNDHAYIYASHLKMSFVMNKNIQGFAAHPSDYYEITKRTNYKG